MELNELVAAIRQKHRRDISAFQHELFAEDGTFSALSMEDENRKVPRIGPVPSLVNRLTRLTIVADIAELSFLEQDESLEGSCVTVSMAGHHRVMDSRVSVDGLEARAWLQAVLGDEWARHAYQQGMLSGVGGGNSTLYFRLFLDKEHRPCDRPAKFDGPALVPVDYDASYPS